VVEPLSKRLDVLTGDMGGGPHPVIGVCLLYGPTDEIPVPDPQRYGVHPTKGSRTRSSMKTLDIIAVLVMVGAFVPFMVILMLLMRVLQKLRDLREEVVVLKIKAKQGEEARSQIQEDLIRDRSQCTQQHLDLLRLLNDTAVDEGHMEPVEDPSRRQPAIDLHQEVTAEALRLLQDPLRLQDPVSRSNAMTENFRQIYGGDPDDLYLITEETTIGVVHMSPGVGVLGPVNPPEVNRTFHYIHPRGLDNVVMGPETAVRFMRANTVQAVGRDRAVDFGAAFSQSPANPETEAVVREKQPPTRYERMLDDDSG